MLIHTKLSQTQRPLLADRVRDITVKHVRAFVTACEKKSMTKAAMELNISQPAFSRSIKDLEGNLGCELIVRSSQGLELTPQGLDFLPAARRLLACYRDVLCSIDSKALQSTSLGLHSALADVLAPQLLHKLKQSLPDLRIDIAHGNSQLLIAQLLDASREQVIATYSSKLAGMDVKPLLNAPYGLLFSPAYAQLAQFKSIHDLAGVQLVQHLEEQELWAFVGQCLPIAVQYFDRAMLVPSFSTALALVNNGLAATITTGITASHPGAKNLTFVPLPGISARSEVSLCAHPLIAAGPDQRRLADQLQIVVRSLSWHQSVTVLV
jgi:DNA-binding transcriptional LysR family regulator